MSLIVSPDGDHRDLVDAVKAGAMPAIAAAIFAAVRGSVKSHPMSAGMTQAELNRRRDICFRWFETLRGDLGWPVDRVLSALGSALAAELDGRTYEPDTSATMWKANEDIEPLAALLRAQPTMHGALAGRLN